MHKVFHRVRSLVVVASSITRAQRLGRFPATSDSIAPPQPQQQQQQQQEQKQKQEPHANSSNTTLGSRSTQNCRRSRGEVLSRRCLCSAPEGEGGREGNRQCVRYRSHWVLSGGRGSEESDGGVWARDSGARGAALPAACLAKRSGRGGPGCKGFSSKVGEEGEGGAEFFLLYCFSLVKGNAITDDTGSHRVRDRDPTVKTCTLRAPQSPAMHPLPSALLFTKHHYSTHGHPRRRRTPPPGRADSEGLPHSDQGNTKKDNTMRHYIDVDASDAESEGGIVCQDRTEHQVEIVPAPPPPPQRRPRSPSPSPTEKTKSNKDSNKSPLVGMDPQPGDRLVKKFYAVARGRQPGVYTSWPACEATVKGHSGAVFKSFPTREAAVEFARSRIHGDGDGDGDGSLHLGPSGRQPDPGVPRAHAPEAKRARLESGGGSSSSIRTADVFAAAHLNSSGTSVRHPSAPGQAAAAAGHTVVYVDGACSRNGRRGAAAGYGGYYGPGDPRNFSRPVPRQEGQTNNRGELRAVIHVLLQGLAAAGLDPAAVTADDPAGLARVPQAAEVLPALRRPPPRLFIYTDSRYVMDGLERYSVQWGRNGYRTANGEAVKNADLWRFLVALRDVYNAAACGQQQQQPGGGGAGVQLGHVKGHAKIAGNEMADRLAVQGAARGGGAGVRG